jgi:Spy/CpxP family protein refolding chaperone
MLDPRIALVTLAISGAGALGLGAWTAYAHGGLPGGFHGRRDPAMIHKFVDFAVNEKLDEIGATDAQRQKVREIKDRLIRDAHALKGTKGAFRDDLLKVLEQDEVDAAQVKAMARQRTEAFTRFVDEAADAVVELHGVFTPEQRKQLLADLREHLSRHGH